MYASTNGMPLDPPAAPGAIPGGPDGPTSTGVDTNAGHLAAWVLDPQGNPAGQPVTVPLDLAGLLASARDGRLRHAVSTPISIAKTTGCVAIAVEDLDCDRARAEGRETPGRGRRGKAFPSGATHKVGLSPVQ